MIATKQADFAAATGGFNEVQPRWMPATAVRPIIPDDPCLLWLQHNGRAHGFEPDRPRYSFLEYIGRKAKEFEDCWVRKAAVPNAVMVCSEPYLVRQAKYVGQTPELMKWKVSVIFQGALWWPAEEVYGTPEIIWLRSWLFETFPQLGTEDGRPDHNVVLDMKFTTGLETDSNKKKDLGVASAQTRLYSYMLGHIQQVMPSATYLVTRDRPLDPIKVDVLSRLGEPLDQDLAEYRRIYQEIRQNPDVTPWTDHKLRPNLSFTSDEPWHGAKKIIAAERYPGRTPELLYYVSRSKADRPQALGYPSLDALLAEEPGRLPLPMNQTRLRQCAILHAQRMGLATAVPREIVPRQYPVELLVDYEHLNNTNVRFDDEWPELRGREMVFMIGVGRMSRSGWSQRILVAESETPEVERKLFHELAAHLDELGVIESPGDAAIYHWCPPERWQTQRFIDRVGGLLGFKLGAALNRFIDLREVFHAGNLAIPGALDYGLKPVARALSAYDARHASDWSNSVMDGTEAMVAGWCIYAQPEPLTSEEHRLLPGYLETDCKSLHQILRWLRSAAR